MLKTIIILTIISTLVSSQALDIACPIGRQPLDFFTGSFSIGDLSSPHRFQPGTDILCINYTFPATFASSPSIAVAFTEFESQRTSDLFGSVKPLLNANQNTNQIPFQVRTQWKYTTWIKLSVNFLAQTRSDMQAAYHQVDTGVVGGCGDARVQGLLLPLRTRFDSAKPLGVRVFLNGFEITTLPTTANINTPYEVQLLNANLTAAGIWVYLATSTPTQVYAIHISTLVYSSDPNDPIPIIAGALDRISIIELRTEQIAVTQQPFIGNQMIYGFSGFIINQNFAPRISLKLDQSLTLTINAAGMTIIYIRFQYAIFNYNPCSNCPGYPLQYLNQCTATCPPNTILSSRTCTACPPNSSPSSPTTCSCNQGSFNVSGVCITCPPGNYFSGTQCVSCGPNAEVFMGGCRCINGFYNISGVCTACQIGTQWNGVQCVANCAQGMQWNGVQCVCVQQGAVWNGQACVLPAPPTPTPSQCGNTAYWNGQSCQCYQGGYYWNGVACLPVNPSPNPNPNPNPNPIPGQCDPTAYWNGAQCVCRQPNQYWNGLTCVNQVNPLPQPQPPQPQPPQCPPNSYWNGNYCFCTMPGQYWNGITCIASTTPAAQCPPDAYWNGANCICYKPGQYWNGLSCSQISGTPIQCPPNSYWTGNTCQCFDMNSYWNGNACVSGVMPTLCPSVAYWNGRVCVCFDNQTYWNGQSCVRGVVSQCNQPSTYWNGLACVCCPGFVNVSGNCVVNTNWNCTVIPNSFWNGYRCECKQGYVWAFGFCVPVSIFNGSRPPRDPNDDDHHHHGGNGGNNGGGGSGNRPFPPFPPNNFGTCSQSMYFDQPAQKCLPCPQGCSRCNNCTTCLACSRGYQMNNRGLCSQICGDGLRFTLQCDDSNTINGDGCSSRCEVEPGWSCAGGSPNSRDYCTNGRPQRIIMQQTAQSMALGKATVNIRVNWIPQEIIRQQACRDCNNLFKIDITKGGPGASITTNYLPGTSYSFSIVFDFMNNAPVQQFCANIQISPEFQRTYFSGIEASQVLNVVYDPAVFSLKEDVQALTLG